MKTEKIKISKLQENPDNPRLLRADKKEKLEKSIKEFPEMLSARPIVVNQEYTILGGNMRYKALLAIGAKEVEVVVVDWSEEKQKEFIIKDNVGFGEWDWDLLENKWEASELTEWGLDTFFDLEPHSIQNEYTQKIDAPVYEPTGDKPKIVDLYKIEKYNNLVSEIDKSSVPDDIKDFLKLCASRHIVFDYENIAEYYSHSDKQTQDLMEKSALVIIDFEKAIEYGFTRLNEQVQNQYTQDYE